MKYWRSSILKDGIVLGESSSGLFLTHRFKLMRQISQTFADLFKDAGVMESRDYWRSELHLCSSGEAESPWMFPWSLLKGEKYHWWMRASWRSEVVFQQGDQHHFDCRQILDHQIRFDHWRFPAMVVVVRIDSNHRTSRGSSRSDYWDRDWNQRWTARIYPDFRNVWTALKMVRLYLRRHLMQKQESHSQAAIPAWQHLLAMYSGSICADHDCRALGHNHQLNPISSLQISFMCSNFFLHAAQ